MKPNGYAPRVQVRIQNLPSSYNKLGHGVTGSRRESGDNEWMDRTALTPGRLYARLSTEFRRVRPEHCGNCRMPMVVLTHRLGPDECNWTVEPPSTLCDGCGRLIAAIVQKVSTEYDLHDPISVPFFPNPSISASLPSSLRC